MNGRRSPFSYFLSLLLLLAIAAPAGAHDASALPPVDELAASLRSLQVVGGPLPASAGVYRVGHLTVGAGAGKLYAVTAVGRPVGVFLHGEGRFSYRSENRLERDLFPLNARRVSRFGVKEGTLSGELDRALVLDPAIADRLEGFALSGEPAPEAVRKAFAGHVARFEDDRAPLEHLVAQAMIEGAGETVTVARLEAGRDDLLYVHDGLREHAEDLLVLKRLPSGTAVAGQRYAEGLSHRPMGDPLGRPPVRYLLTEVDLELANPEDRALTLDVREVFEVKSPLRTIALDLWSERFTDDGAFPYTPRSVTTAGGERLRFAHRLNDLVVELPEPAAPGQKIELSFRIEGDVLDLPGGHSFWRLPIGSWLPIPTRIDQPIQFAVILAGKYHTYTEERDGFRITLASYAFSHDESMKKMANNMFEIKKLYELLLGEFSFDELHVVEINQFGFGIAPPGVIYLTRKAFDPRPAGRRYREELNLRMAHEMAHQYWGHVAQMAGFEEQWLSESTAEYTARWRSATSWASAS